MTIDLDALEKLAADLRVSWSERGWVASKKIDGLLKEARQASNGLTALIAELKEAREALIAVKISADHMPPTSSTKRLAWRIMSFNPAMAQVRAFLARNGKGEG